MTTEERLEYLTEKYCAGEYELKTFCDLFEEYFSEIRSQDIASEWFELMREIADKCARYSPYRQDIEMSGYFIGDDEMRKHILRAKDRLDKIKSGKINKITCAEAGSAASCVLDFINDIKEVCMHSFLMLRRGKIFAEMSYGGITPEMPQRLYSVSKTFGAAAIGMLEYEGRLSLDDRVSDILGIRSEYRLINEMTVRDCLRMMTCHDGTTYKYTDPDWVMTFFMKKPSHPAGTVFHYDTSAAHVLGSIAEELTGEPLMDYLRRKMGLSEGADCVRSPEGHSWAGSGVIANLYDMAKLGLLFMNGGVLGGKRLMSEEYSRAATSVQTENDSGFNHRWTDGYGYQIWLTKYGYVFYGMGSQDVVCVPEKDFIFVCTADTMGEPLHGRLIEEALLRDVVDKLDTGVGDTKEDNERLAAMRPRFPIAQSVSEHVSADGKYVLEENPMRISKLELDTENGVMRYMTERGARELRFGMNEYTDTVFPETHYFGMKIGESANRPYRCKAGAAWVSADKLRIKVWLTDIHTGGVNITLAFKGGEIAVCMRKHGEWYLDEYSGFAAGRKM